MATHSSVLPWKIPWAEEQGRHGVAKELDMTQQVNNNKNRYINKLLVTEKKKTKNTILTRKV